MQQASVDANLINTNYTHSFDLEPERYRQWYSNLQKQYLPYYYTPQIYQQWYLYYRNYQQQLNAYQYNMQFTNNYHSIGNTNLQQYQVINYPNIPGNIKTQSKQKLSRNQKRKIKKKELQEQYDKQKKQIGKWVDLQRKDLVEGLKKIQQQQQKIKQKRKQKLSHLIQIHKEVYKHMLKKNKEKLRKKQDVGNFRKKKKKPSHIKRMKQLYKQLQSKQENQMRQARPQEMPKPQEMKVEQNHEEDFITESESDNQSDKQEQIKVKKQDKQRSQQKNQGKNKSKKIRLQNKKDQQKIETKEVIVQKQQDFDKVTSNKEQNQNQIKTIEYKYSGKLNGLIYNGIELRQWVDQVPSAKLQDLVLRFINRLAYKQAIKKVNQPEKARKIIIAGLHECRRTLWTKIDKKKSKMLIVALNIERNIFERGTDDQIQQLLSYANQAKVPIVHISTRSKIGRAFTGKFGPRITTVSVVNCEGYQDMMSEIVEQWHSARKLYEETNPYCFKF